MKKLSYDIEGSYIDSLLNKHMYILIAPDEAEEEDEIQDGDARWEIKRNFPLTNPDGYGMYFSAYDQFVGHKALESLRGTSVSDDNYIQMTPGKIASDISYPDEENLDEFIYADCKAIGNGGKFYEIVNKKGIMKDLRI